MHRNEHLRKAIKIFIVTFLCSEMQLNLLIPIGKNTSIGYAYAAEFNATYANLEDSRHHASIRLTELDDHFGDGHICSGALIAPSVILTAAQCVFDYVKNSQRHPSELRVVMGTQNRYQRMQHTFVYSVTHLYIPPSFDSQTLRDNIAILMLERDIFENVYVKPIAIGLHNTEAILSGNSQVTSWSTTEKGEPVPSLMLFNISLSNDIACNHSYGKIYADHMVCVHFMDINQNPCPYDAGAPLLVDGELVGLSSIGSDCSVKHLPAIYIDIRYYLEWIRQQIGDGTNQNSSIWGIISFLLFTAFVIKTKNIKKRSDIFGF